MHYRHKLQRSTIPKRSLRFEPLELRRVLASDFTLLKDLNPTLQPTQYYDFLSSGPLTYMFAEATEQWTSNREKAGTVMVMNIAAGSASSHPTRLTAIGSQLYFVADDITHDAELWISRGTADTTRLEQDFYAGRFGSSPAHILVFRNKLFVNAFSDAFGREWWSRVDS